MRTAFSVSLASIIACVLAVGLRAEEKKEVTLKGEIMCAKCELKEKDLKKCQTVIQVKEAGKDVTYYFADKGNKETYHEEVCGGGRKEGSVTGTVAEKDGKKWITPSKVDYAKKGADLRGGNSSAPQVAGCCAAPARKAQAGCCCCRGG